MAFRRQNILHTWKSGIPQNLEQLFMFFFLRNLCLSDAFSEEFANMKVKCVIDTLKNISNANFHI